MTACRSAIHAQPWAQMQPNRDETQWTPASPSGDVLTPAMRTRSLGTKIGLRFGLNRSSYSNDRYLDNTPFDVGDVSGETEIYSSAAGFGMTGGIDVEYPLNRSMGVVASLQYDHVHFSSTGSVSEPCIRRDSVRLIGSSIHDFQVSIDFITLALAAKIDFSGWYMLGGLSASHPLATSLVRTKTLGATDCFFPGTDGLTRIQESGTIPIPRRVHYALRLGAGLAYQLNKYLTFAPEITLDFGMNPINKSPNSDLGIYAICATLRYDLR